MIENKLFHAGEKIMQARARVSDKAEIIAQRLILNHMSEQHQEFFPLLNTLFVASIDEQGQPWASVLIGQPGFIQAVDKNHLRLKNSVPVSSDPLNKNLKLNHSLGFLGLEFHTRRRNRLAGKLISNKNNQLEFHISQAFGNCPKYIQARAINVLEPLNNSNLKNDVKCVKRFNDDIKSLINKADTFFIASYSPASDFQLEPYGADISHRGGKPGFVEIEDDTTLSFDDFSGNNLFMTLGNLTSNPVAGLLFIDFESGDTLQISCCSEIIETPNSKYDRKIRLSLNHGWFTKSALAVKSEFLEYSKFI